MKKFLIAALVFTSCGSSIQEIPINLYSEDQTHNHKITWTDAQQSQQQTAICLICSRRFFLVDELMLKQSMRTKHFKNNRI